MRESIIQDTLDNILFTKVKEDDLLPLTLCRNPELISLVVNFIHQKVDSHVHDKKDNLRVSLMIPLISTSVQLGPPVNRSLGQERNHMNISVNSLRLIGSTPNFRLIG